MSHCGRQPLAADRAVGGPDRAGSREPRTGMTSSANDAKAQRKFKFLGAAFGETDFCTERLQRRAQKAKILMEQIGHTEDAQAA